MIDLRLKGCRAFGLGFERPLEMIHDRGQMCEAPVDGSVEHSRALPGARFLNSLW